MFSCSRLPLILSVLCVIPSASISVAQDGSQQEVMARMRKQQAEMMDTQFFMQQLMQLGFSSELRKELEIVDDQVESVKELAQEYQKEMMDFYRGNRELQTELQDLYQSGKHEEARELSLEYQEKQREFNDGFMNKAAGTLLPHQVDRLKQISKQQRVKTMNQFQDEFGVTSALADEIGLSEQEKKRLLDAIKAARKAYYEEVEAAKKKANAVIMAALTTEQQEKLRGIIGDPYDQQQMSRRARDRMRAKPSESRK
jgi:hypothetical protein